MEITETMRINRIIVQNAGMMNEDRFFTAQIREWLSSPARQEQLDGERYYAGDHDILYRERKVIGEGGELQTVKNLPNNRLIDNQYALMVDQKTNYLVGKPISVNSDDKAAVEKVNAVLDKRFRRTLKYTAEDALKGGLAWMFPRIEENQLVFDHFPAWEILPFWADADHTRLDCAVRLYEMECWTGTARETVRKVEIFRSDGLYRYELSGDALVPDVELGEFAPYITRGETALAWDRIPLIPFKYNKGEIPLLRRVRSLQDAINELISDFMNNMQEDARNTILVIRNYDGQDLGEFRRNLASYGAVKVREDGSVDTLTVTVDSTNYKELLDLLKKALIENARGYNAKDDRMGANPNQMNIQSMYSDIDLDANGMEAEFQAAMDEVLWFVSTWAGGLPVDDINIVFNRDILINESEAIDNCSKSAGILSAETIVEQHPWTVDAKTELDRLAKEKEERMEDYPKLFPQQKTDQEEDGDDEA